MTLCEKYLSERGITNQTAKLYGIERDERICAKKVKDRLGRKINKGYNEVLWFPIHNPSGNVIDWIARPLPTIASEKAKYYCPLGSSGLAFVPKLVYQLAFGKPVIITEGPVKAIVCVQAGVAAIGINGVWGASVKNAQDLYVIRAELQNALDWRGRKVCFGFDADCDINPLVREALFRLYFILCAQGAECFQLTNWKEDQGKGIDDFLVKQTGAGNGTAELLGLKEA
jgi:hypothetical protein